MIDTLALWLGYAAMCIGGISVVGALAWLVVEQWWQYCGHARFVADFVRWKREREGAQ